MFTDSMMLGGKNLTLADTGWTVPGAASVVALGGSSTTWSNPNNVLGLPSNYATTGIINIGQYSTLLRVSSLGWTLPPNAIVRGIECEIERHSNGQVGIADYFLSLVNAAGVAVGDNKASPSNWPTTNGIAVYGGANDLWNSGAVQADVEDSDFGAVLAIIATVAFRSAYVDAIRMKCHYAY